MAATVAGRTVQDPCLVGANHVGTYSVLEIVADPGNGVPLHIHSNEEEHFIVVEGTLDIANGPKMRRLLPAQA